LQEFVDSLDMEINRIQNEGGTTLQD